MASSVPSPARTDSLNRMHRNGSTRSQLAVQAEEDLCVFAREPIRCRTVGNDDQLAALTGCLDVGAVDQGMATARSISDVRRPYRRPPRCLHNVSSGAFVASTEKCRDSDYKNPSATSARRTASQEEAPSATSGRLGAALSAGRFSGVRDKRAVRGSCLFRRSGSSVLTNDRQHPVKIYRLWDHVDSAEPLGFALTLV